MQGEQARRSDQLCYLQTKFLAPLAALVQKFSLLQALVEHVVDMSRLPDLVVAAQHCPVLLELQTDMQALEREAEEVRAQTAAGLQRAGVQVADIKLESSAQLSFFLRSARGDDERQLRQGGGGKVEVLSLQKVGFLSVRQRAIEKKQTTMRHLLDLTLLYAYANAWTAICVCAC